MPIRTLPPLQSPGSLADQLCAALLRAIISGRFQPGDRIRTDRLAAHFAVSRIPLREALRTLEAGGWVHIHPRRGAFVRAHSATELRQLCETQGILMPAVARLAAERRTPAQLVRLRRSLHHPPETPAPEDHPDEDVTLGNAFHRACADAANNACCARLVAEVELHLQWYRTRIPPLQAAAASEEAVLEAIAAGDGGGAEATMRRHLLAIHDAALVGLDAPGRLPP